MDESVGSGSLLRTSSRDKPADASVGWAKPGSALPASPMLDSSGTHDPRDHFGYSA